MSWHLLKKTGAAELSHGRIGKRCHGDLRLSKPISFLIVDDKAYMRRVVKNVLETLGAKHIEEAYDGSEASPAFAAGRRISSDRVAPLSHDRT